MKTNKFLSYLLVFCLILGCFSLSFYAAENDNVEINMSDIDGNATDYGLMDTAKGSTILHCFCWSFNTIKENIQKIAEAGFTSIQTSPINECRVGEGGGLKMMSSSNGKWYYHYQPISYDIGNYQLGTEEEFKDMCEEAHKYGLKVIVDAVLNHTSDVYYVKDSIKGLSDNILDIYHEGYNTADGEISDYSNRFQLTQKKMTGIPDLRTQNPVIQQVQLDFLKRCVADGADGFRYDAAKHIELPDDSSIYSSEFWPTILDNGSEFQYGEILQGTGSRFTAYGQLMNVTASNFGINLRNELKNSRMNKNNISNFSAEGLSTDKLVGWVESHDNYCNDGTYSISNTKVRQGWAVLASQGITSLFFSRPNGSSTSNQWGDNLIGPRGDDNFFNSEVAAVNHFHNDMNGKAASLRNIDTSGKVLAIDRENSGTVIVNTNSSAYTVNAASSLPNGTYVDSAHGYKYTVSGGYLKGTVAGNSVAVIYKLAQGDETEETTQPIETKKVRFVNTLGWKTPIYVHYWGGSEETDWPGNQMSFEKASAEGNVYTADVPTDSTGIIFDNGSGNYQTVDLSFNKNVTGWKALSSTDSAGHYHAQTYVDSTDTTAPSETEPTEMKTVRFVNTQNWAAPMYAYYWGGNDDPPAWPGTQMTFEKTSSEGDVYKIDVPADSQYIIFNNGKGSGKYQTVNIEFDLGVVGWKALSTYDSTGWYYVRPYAEEDETAEPTGTTAPATTTQAPTTTAPETIEPTETEPVETKTVRFIKPQNWASPIFVYYYGGKEESPKWPGKVMSFEKFISQGNVYKAEIPSDTSYIVFNNCVGKNKNQTVNIEYDQSVFGWKITGETDINGWYNAVPFTEDEETPTTEPQTVEPTTTQAPTTEPQTVEPTTTEAPTTEPQTVEPTTTEAPTTEPQTVEPTTAEPVTTKTVRFLKPQSWASPIFVYYYGCSEESPKWPGKMMTFEKFVTEGNIFKADIPSDCTNVVFNNCIGRNKYQTVDIEYDNTIYGWKSTGETDTNGYYKTVPYTGEEETQPVTTEPATEAPTSTDPSGTKTVRFVKPQDWASPIFVCYYGGSEESSKLPGKAMTFEKFVTEGNVYKAEIPSDSKYVVFNNCIGNNKKKTVNIDLTQGDFWKTTGLTDDSGCYYTEVYSDATEPPATTGEPTTEPATSSTLADGYYLVGSINGDNSWNPSAHTNLCFIANTAASGEYMLTGVTLTAGDMVKVVKVVNQTVTTWYPDGSGNNCVINASGKYNIYFRPDGGGYADWHEGYFYLAKQ